MEKNHLQELFDAFIEKVAAKQEDLDKSFAKQFQDMMPLVNTSSEAFKKNFPKIQRLATERAASKPEEKVRELMKNVWMKAYTEFVKVRTEVDAALKEQNEIEAAMVQSIQEQRAQCEKEEIAKLEAAVKSYYWDYLE